MIPYMKAEQQQERPDRGKLKIQVYAALRSLPVADAEISISYTGDPGNILEEVKTNASGESPEVELPTPPLEYSVEPSEYQPYSEYTLRITKEGYAPVDISGTELLSGQTALQPVYLEPLTPEVAPVRFREQDSTGVY